MDGLELRQTLLENLVTSMNKSVADRVDTHSSPHHNYLTGRIETLRTLLEFVMNAQVGPQEGPQENPSPVKDGSKSAPKRKRSK